MQLALWMIMVMVDTKPHGVDNLLVTRVGQTRLSRDKWLNSFYIDLTGFRKELGNLETFAAQLRDSVDNLKGLISMGNIGFSNRGLELSNVTSVRPDTYMMSTSKLLYSNLIENSYEEIALVTEFLDETTRMFTDLSRHTATGLYVDPEHLDRVKRSFWSLAVQFIDFALGIKSQVDMKSLTKGIRNLQKQNQLQNIAINDLISVANASSHAIVENRNSIEGLNDITRTIVKRIDEVSLSIDRFISREYLIVAEIELNSQTSILSDTLGHLNMLLSRLTQGLDMASQGKLSPTLIRPQTLLNTLVSIKDALPDTLKLPVEPTTDSIWYYYKNLVCDVMEVGDTVGQGGSFLSFGQT